MKPETFYRRVMIETGRRDQEGAKQATAAVLQALRDRLTPQEADQAVAQLPRELQILWSIGEEEGRDRPLKMHRAEFYERVRGEGGLASLGDARSVTRAVFSALKDQLSPGEGDDVYAQLPKDLKTVWEDA